MRPGDITSLKSPPLAISGGSRGHHQHAPPQWDPILSFSHTFLPKSTRVRGWHPPNGSVLSPMGNPGSAADHTFLLLICGEK